jgi:hypothetical protein
VRIFLGSVTRRVLQQLPCSLLTVKREDFLEDIGQDDVRHVRLLLAEGQALFDSGSYLPAADKFRQLLGHHPFHAGALGYLAQANERLGQTEAAAMCQRRLQTIKEHGLG